MVAAYFQGRRRKSTGQIRHFPMRKWRRNFIGRRRESIGWMLEWARPLQTKSRRHVMGWEGKRSDGWMPACPAHRLLHASSTIRWCFDQL
eukprot:symbB.v1.2.025335.t1/scaffold2447.1/size78899/9